MIVCSSLEIEPMMWNYKHLLVIVDDPISSQGLQTLGFVGASASGNDMTALELGDLDSKVTSPPSCCCDQYRLSH